MSKYKILVFILYTLPITNLLAQENNIRNTESFEVTSKNLLYCQGQAEFKKQHYVEALSYYEKSLNLLHTFKNKEKLLLILIDSTSNSKNDTLIDFVDIKWYKHLVYSSIADVYYSLNDIINAINYYDSSIILLPNQYYAYHKKAEIYSLTNEWERAIDNYNLSYKNKPNPIYLFYIGYCYYKLKNFQLAIENCENSLRTTVNEYKLIQNLNQPQGYDTIFKTYSVASQYPIVYQILGDANFIINNYNKAILYFDTLLHINPNYYEGYYFRASSYFELGDYKKALNDYLSVLKLKEYTRNDNLMIFKAHLYNNVAYCFYKLNELIYALNYYDTLINIDRNNAENYYNRSMVFNDLNNLYLAIKDLEKAYSLEPSPQFLEALAKVYFQLKQPNLAISALEKIVNYLKLEISYLSNPQNPEIIDSVFYTFYPYRNKDVFYSLGLAYREIKNYKKAILYLDSAIAKTSSV